MDQSHSDVYKLFRMCIYTLTNDYLTMPQQVIKPNHHMAFLTDKN